MSVKNISWSLILGLVSGALIGFYFIGLNYIGQQLGLHPGLSFLLPFAFLLIIFVRRNSDFFPTSFKEIREAQVSETKTWSRWVAPINLFLSWISHLAGASLGRESAAAVVSTSLVRVFKLDWSFWRPIVLSASLAMATGYPLIALIIIIELFFSNIEQKFLTVLTAWVGCLVMKTLAVPPLFQYANFNVDNKSFFTAALLTLAVGICCGYLARFYKSASEWLNSKFQQQRNRLQIMFSFLLTLVLVVAVVKLDLTKYQSLSSPMFANIQSGQVTYEFFIVKAVLTLIFISLGFIGGEFVPSLLIGSAIGVLIAPVFSGISNSIKPIFLSNRPRCKDKPQCLYSKLL